MQRNPTTTSRPRWSSDDAITTALRELGLVAPTRETLLIEAGAETTVSRERIWAIWSIVEQWPCWSPMHRAVRWDGAAGWCRGARLFQVTERPLPLGSQHEAATVVRVMPGALAIWQRTFRAVRECHVLQLESLPAGGTRAIDIHVMHGVPMIVLSPMIELSWQQHAQFGVQRLLDLAGRVAPHCIGEEE